MDIFRWPGRPGGITYAVDVSRFRDSDADGLGDLQGLISRMPYLQSLGVDWLWLLPFYPSLRRDNGYDVDDHCAVDPRLGTLEDFRELVEVAHRMGIKVLIDFVTHHTSDRHPWFLEAQKDPASRVGRYYVWSENDEREKGDEPMFPGEDPGVWKYSEQAGLYYHHQFYSFQPDLNANNPDVFEELVKIGQFWLAQGTDGFRVDAATLLVAAKGRPGTDVDDDSFFDRLRARLSETRDDVVLIAESDEPADRLQRLVADNRFDAVLDFTLNNAIHLSLVREDVTPIQGCVAGLDQSVPAAARLNFIRNGDELDLEQLTPEERDEAYRVLAPDPDMLIYDRGIRRAWAPMLQPEERVRMTMSLLMALPGVPLLMAGQEIGEGDDLTVRGRDADRFTMQWDDSPTGGFTQAESSPLILDAQREGDYGYRKVNVAQQEDDPASLLTLARTLGGIRRDLDWEVDGWEVEDVGDRRVLALRHEDVLTIHNVSAQSVVPELPDAPAWQQLYREGWDGRALSPYGFAWLRRES